MELWQIDVLEHSGNGAEFGYRYGMNSVKCMEFGTERYGTEFG